MKKAIQIIKKRIESLNSEKEFAYMGSEFYSNLDHRISELESLLYELITDAANEWWNNLSYNQKEQYRSYLNKYSSIDSPVDVLLFPDAVLLIQVWEKFGK